MPDRYRESGHDTSYRLDGVCADIATVDLNCLVYKYLCDLSNSGRITVCCSRGKDDIYLVQFRDWVESLEHGEALLSGWRSSSWAGMTPLLLFPSWNTDLCGRARVASGY